MEEQSYGDWRQGVHHRLLGRRIPLGGSLELTQRCNNRCIHCYNNLPADDHNAMARELSSDEICRIIDEISELGCLWLLLTGGEIFLRKDFFEIYGYAKQKGFLITLFTNGTLITSDIADLLVDLPPFSIEITLYGSRRKTYESITGVPGSYAGCLNGIKRLTERGLPVKLKTMVVAQNKHEVFELKRFVEEGLGLEFKFDTMINPRRDCSLSPLEVRLDPVDVVRLDFEDKDRITEWRQFAERFHKPAANPADADKLYLCGGGHQSFAVDSFGQLMTCVLSGRCYDLRQGSFKAGWEDFLFNQRQKRATRNTRCRNCLIKPMCGMCPANGELECRDEEAPVEFLCEVAHLRAYAFGLAVAPHGDCEYCRGGTRYEDLVRTVERLRRQT